MRARASTPPPARPRPDLNELPVRLTSLIYTDPKTPGTEPGKNDLHYCQRTTASGDCRLRPAGAERSSFGNEISSSAVRLYVQSRTRPSKRLLPAWEVGCSLKIKHIGVHGVDTGLSNT